MRIASCASAHCGAGVAVLLLCTAVSTIGAQSNAIVVRAGTLIDGSGGDPIRNAVIVIEGERITAVGTNVREPNGARVIDLSAHTVLPGFIDAHTHMLGPTLGEPGWENALVRETAADFALRGVQNARKTIDAGFTTVRNVGAGFFSDVSLRDAINKGYVVGPRMQVSAHALGITGGHCDVNGFVPNVFGREPGFREGVANGRDEIFKAIRYQVKYGADVIKICATGGVLSEGDSVGVQQYTDEELRDVVEAAHMVERSVAAHAHGTVGIKAAVRAGVTSVEHGSILDDEAVRLMVEHDTYLVPTLMAGAMVMQLVDAGVLTGERADKATAIAPLMRHSFKLAVDGGVKVALGTDAGVFPHGQNGREFALMVEYGMIPMQAIVAGTQNAADLLGWGDRIGGVAAGRYADIVAVEGNPLQDITVLQRVVFVMKGGEVMKYEERPTS